MPFSNPILGGTALVRPAIKSPNYKPGGPGWSINQDGTAEFSSLIIDPGAITAITITFTDGSSVKLYGGTYELHNAFMGTIAGTFETFTPATHAGNTWAPAGIGTTLGVSNGQSTMFMASPWDRQAASDWQSEIIMFNRGSSTSGANIQIATEWLTINLNQSGFGNQRMDVNGAMNVNGAMSVTGQTVLHAETAFGGGIHDLPATSLTLITTVASNAAWQTVSYPLGTSEQWDVQGQHQTATNIVIQRTGIYNVMHYAAWPNNTTNQRGSRLLYSPVGGGSSNPFTITPQPTSGLATVCTMSGQMLLTAGDVLAHQVFQNSGSTLSLTAYLQVSYYQSAVTI